jgi:hypothetical protein
VDKSLKISPTLRVDRTSITIEFHDADVADSLTSVERIPLGYASTVTTLQQPFVSGDPQRRLQNPSAQELSAF